MAYGQFGYDHGQQNGAYNPAPSNTGMAYNTYNPVYRGAYF